MTLDFCIFALGQKPGVYSARFAEKQGGFLRQ